MKLKIVFMGSAKFSIPILSTLIRNLDVVGVVTQPDKPAGRGKKLTAPEVKEYSISHEIPVIQPKTLKDPSAFEQIYEWNPELIVVAAFGQILRQNVLDLPKFGCLNVHPSLLPRWRGVSPIQAAIINGDDFTGITIMKMDIGLDTGPILTQKKLAIFENDTAGSLSDRLSEYGAITLLETISEYTLGTIQPILQDNTTATYAPMIKKEDGELNFNYDASYLHRKVRAYSPWPGAYMNWENQHLKIHKTHVIAQNELTSEKFSIPGKRIIFEKFPAIITNKDILVLDQIQVPGKKIINGTEFIQGVRNW